jgi:hypothetical protein
MKFSCKLPEDGDNIETGETLSNRKDTSIVEMCICWFHRSFNLH